jgi:hypothetical protein
VTVEGASADRHAGGASAVIRALIAIEVIRQ